MTKLLVITCALFIIQGTYLKAQSITRFVILDSASQEAVPFVNVAVKNTTRGTFSNTNGIVEIFFLESDTLTISAIGYKSMCAVLKDINSDTLYLKPNELILSEVQVSSNRRFKKKRIANHRNKLSGGFSSALAALRRYTLDSNEEFLLEKVSIRFFQKGINRRNPLIQKVKPMLVRLLVMAPDSIQKPGLTLLTKDIVQRVEPKQEYAHYELDAILLPKTFFVGVEYLGYFNGDTFIPFSNSSWQESTQFASAFSTETLNLYSWYKQDYASGWRQLGPMGKIYNFSFGIELVY